MMEEMAAFHAEDLGPVKIDEKSWLWIVDVQW